MCGRAGAAGTHGNENRGRGMFPARPVAVDALFSFSFPIFSKWKIVNPVAILQLAEHMVDPRSNLPSSICQNNPYFHIRYSFHFRFYSGKVYFCSRERRGPDPERRFSWTGKRGKKKKQKAAWRAALPWPPWRRVQQRCHRASVVPASSARSSSCSPGPAARPSVSCAVALHHGVEQRGGRWVSGWRGRCGALARGWGTHRAPVEVGNTLGDARHTAADPRLRRGRRGRGAKARFRRFSSRSVFLCFFREPWGWLRAPPARAPVQQDAERVVRPWEKPQAARRPRYRPPPASAPRVWRLRTTPSGRSVIQWVEEAVLSLERAVAGAFWTKERVTERGDSQDSTGSNFNFDFCC